MADWKDEKGLAYHPVVRGVAAALKGRCGICTGDKVVVGVSGGADSVALLLAMEFLSKRRGRGMEIAVGHVQHHLRDCAEGDAGFVEALAKGLGLAYFRADLDLSRSTGNIEAAAREGRYQSLLKMARGWGARHVAVAHHADDQMETVLLNLARGAGLKGLSGMGFRRRLAEGADVWLVRPMLGVGKDEVIDLLIRMNQAYRTDPTNADLTRARARLRAKVLPVMREIHKGAAKNAGRAAVQAREARLALLRRGVEAFGAGDAVPRGVARGLTGAVLAEALRRWLAGKGVQGKGLGSVVVGGMVRAIKDKEGGVRRFELSGGSVLEVTREWVRFMGFESETPHQ
jgi:tRNA(Ile)-lysidine synthase